MRRASFRDSGSSLSFNPLYQHLRRYRILSLFVVFPFFSSFVSFHVSSFVSFCLLLLSPLVFFCCLFSCLSMCLLSCLFFCLLLFVSLLLSLLLFLRLSLLSVSSSVSSRLSFYLFFLCLLFLHIVSFTHLFIMCINLFISFNSLYFLSSLLLKASTNAQLYILSASVSLSRCTGSSFHVSFRCCCCCSCCCCCCCCRRPCIAFAAADGGCCGFAFAQRCTEFRADTSYDADLLHAT